ncbi:hypothetical protein M9H77_12250 [Catharanthus roseus]|uniref:Uncharacterized protein n=1 Tax=Catharanthus roseus TaxID=4058 RepID=A0ACC0BGV9_CATRO|nr:hypothetical protein M9H77_12250 [Catharanthus roseus]
MAPFFFFFSGKAAPVTPRTAAEAVRWEQQQEPARCGEVNLLQPAVAQAAAKLREAVASSNSEQPTATAAAETAPEVTDPVVPHADEAHNGMVLSLSLLKATAWTCSQVARPQSNSMDVQSGGKADS